MKNGTRKKRKKFDDEDDKFPPLRTRVTTKGMYDTMRLLRSEQRDRVEKLGFKAMLYMSLDTLPASIGHFVVSRYIPETNSIDLGNVKLKVTEERIHKILGISKEGINLSTVKDCTGENKFLKLWNDQKKNLTTSQSSLSNLIEGSKETDELFDMNFIMLFVNTMIEKKPSGDLDTKVLMKLPNIKDKTKINWCKYLNEALMRTKDGWNPQNPKSYYTGPLPFLIVRILSK